MRNKNIMYIVLGIFLSLCLVSITVFIPSENYSSDINNQEKTPLQPSAGEIIIITPENKTYTSAMSGYYSATYSFDEDNVGENPNNWVVSENGGSCNVITEIDGHTKVIELYDTSDSDFPYVLNYFDNNKTTGTVEWWWCSDSSTGVVQFLITDADNSAHVNILTSYTSTTYIQYYDDTTHNIAQYLPDTWYHMKVQFDVAGQWYLWINGAQYGPYNYQGTPQGMDRFYVGMNYDPSNYYCYIDAVGYSWDSNYELGSNIYEGLLLSFENSTNLDWIGYSFDNENNITISGNKTIPILNMGQRSVQVFGNDSFGTMYQSEKRYFTIEPLPLNIITPENKTYTEMMFGYYPATFGFEDDKVGTKGTEISFVDSIGANGYAEIVEKKEDHKKVLNYSLLADYEQINNNFYGREKGTIEFWIYYENTITSEIYLPTGEGKLYLSPYDGSLRIFDGAWHTIGSYSTRIWYHYAITWDCSIGQWNLRIDGEFIGKYSFDGSPSYFYQIRFDGKNGANFYLDAIGYSWDSNYELFNNFYEGILLSFTNYTSFSHVEYSFNDQEQIEILGNITLPIPENGQHTIKLFARDTESYFYESDTKYFTLDLPQCSINKQIIEGSSEPFNEENIKLNDGIFDETTFGSGFGGIIHMDYANSIIDYEGLVWGTTDPRTEYGNVFDALKDDDNFYLFLEADNTHGYTPGTIYIRWGNYQNFITSVHQYLTEIRIYYEVMADAGWWPNILDTGSNFRLYYYDSVGYSSSTLIASNPIHQQHYSGVISISSGTLFDHVKSGGYIESMKLEMYSGEGLLSVTWINIDFIDIYYYFDKPDIDFLYQFNCSEYCFENITEFDLNIDVIETVSGLNVHLWNFETSSWDYINQISNTGFHSLTIDNNADHYFDEDEIIKIRFERSNYWDGRPYTSYHIKIDFIKIRIPPPDPPPNLMAYQESLHIHLDWDDSYTYGAPVLYYKIYRGESEGGVKTLIAISSNTEYNDNDIEFCTTYYYEISAYSHMGESDTSNIEIMFQDTTDPVWNPNPEDQTIELGEPFSYEVNADDESAITYFIDDTTHFAINSGTGLITDAISLTVGEYWLEITATDPFGNDITAIIKISVEDTTGPVWNPIPEDQTIELGDPLSYEVNANDLSGVIYFVDDTTHFAINSGTGLITNATALTVGEYWLEITATDSFGNDITAMIKITVEDTTGPVWNPDPENQTIELGDPLSYEMNADDLSTIAYSINDTTHFSIDSGAGLITNTTDLAIGDYWLEITAEDPYGNDITTVIKITVEDTTSPVWNPDPENQTIELGDPFSYEVNANDLSGVIYSVNDTTHFSIDSGTGLITNTTDLAIGDYWLEITAEDPYGNDITTVIKITVEDTTGPVWNPNPEDQTIKLGDAFSYEVNADDLSTIAYSINDTTHFAINSGTGLITNATNLVVGDYWLEITATDPYGNDITTVIKINVDDTTGPVWNPNPEDQTIELGDPFTYEVNADDLSTIAYSINDTTHFAINSGTGLITNASNLVVGDYWLEITATDPYGNDITTVIKITVDDTTGPVWNPNPEDQTIELGDPFTYEVNADDISTITYSINDTTYFAINSGTGLITNAIDLVVGEYWLQITAIDPYGNDISTIIKLTVEKSTSQPSAIPGFEILIVSICIIITWIGIIVYDKKKLKI